MSKYGNRRILHQICIVDGGSLPLELPQEICENVESFKRCHSDASYRLWSRNDLRDFIKDKFDTSVLDAFDALVPYAYKCNLGRLCIIYDGGGIYSDLSMRFLHPFAPPVGVGFAAFRSLSFLTPSWTTISDGIIWADPGRRELQIAIEMIIENCQNRFYGRNALYPTGPVLFGRAVAAAMVEKRNDPNVDDQWIGEVRRNPEVLGQNFHVAPDGTTIAINMKSGRSLHKIGLAGANVYVDFWNKKSIYKS